MIKLKLVRVVNVFSPSMYLYSKTYKSQCSCKNNKDTYIYTERNTNPLKIFKNQVNYMTKLGKSLYYDTVDEKTDEFCDVCNTKY